MCARRCVRVVTTMHVPARAPLGQYEGVPGTQGDGHTEAACAATGRARRVATKCSIKRKRPRKKPTGAVWPTGSHGRRCQAQDNERNEHGLVRHGEFDDDAQRMANCLMVIGSAAQC